MDNLIELQKLLRDEEQIDRIEGRLMTLFPRVSYGFDMEDDVMIREFNFNYRKDDTVYDVTIDRERITIDRVED